MNTSVTASATAPASASAPTTMQVNFFTVQQPTGVLTPVETLSASFGSNIPAYLSLKGGNGNGPSYVFCVAVTTDVNTICNTYGYLCQKMYPKEIDLNKYNPSSKILIINSFEQFRLI